MEQAVPQNTEDIQSISFSDRVLRSPASQALRSQTMAPLPNTRRGLAGLNQMRLSSVYRRAEDILRVYPLFT